MLACRNEECTYPQDGRCLEGFANLSECPNVLSTSSSTEPTMPPAAVDATTDVELPEGNDYDVDTIRNLTLAVPVRIVVLAAPVKTGKTTLLASLYHAFQEGPFAG